MKRDQDMFPGGQKKFLYEAPKSGKSSRSQESQWSLSSKKPGKLSDTRLDLDDVWSIKKNVSLKKTTPRSDQLNLNVNSHFYSRHGGLKDRSTGGQTTDLNNRSYMSTDGERSWTTGRRGFSYSSQTATNQKTDSSNAHTFKEDSPGLTDDRQNINGYRFGKPPNNSDPFRF